MSHLILASLTRRYGAATAVDALSLEVGRGECIALLGPSGCGKTTTLRMVAGFVVPDAGTITLDGRRIEREPAHRRAIGMVFQAYALFPHMTVAGNVGFGLEMRHIGRAERDVRVGRALEMVGLVALAERWPSQLSGGQQQRVALARALVTEPDLLLLDEPLSNLDASLRGEMRSEIDRLRRRLGITTLFVTHDQEEALALADRIAVMQAGRLVECSDPRSLSEAPQHVFTAGFLGSRSVIAGRADAGRFQAEGINLPAPPGATHLVLRAARLRLLPAGAASDAALTIEAVVAEAAWLGDTIAYEVTAGAHRLRVIRPSTEAAFAPGQPVRVAAEADAIAWIHDTTTGAAA
ncbi:putative spermidine/putrescine transport system ATP-binding protein [Humitalea rosea]|uniref:Putative spermidine/putrescine transport system ATP-binding protein n=1 Tax=Humitalea rosea TaxID=990373 RepID=A0A2W7J678_9PROT|nr:ABC transporter ATP-binding protein [Humitalea rosea]PZW46642.1 putative spermidine/putrescine transport system ATP-binding protein [Humitalea rosea]